MVEIVVVVVYLDGRELALVYDVFGGEGADVEPFGERAKVGGELNEVWTGKFPRNDER